MIVNNARLLSVAVNASGFPAEDLPEIAFTGRSNVGKSSLVNFMLYRKSIARVGKSPGKTRTINFYEAEGAEGAVRLVDLPGYGFAAVSKSETRNWGKMIEGYLKNRRQLRAIALLIDSRRPPTELDMTMYEWLNFYKGKEGFGIIAVATKFDKLNAAEKPSSVKAIAGALALPESGVIPFSSQARTGRAELWAAIENFTAR
ncbi:MAG: ribosome biogenesis GTP-binding protein YihA/YsxC [Clostridiales bacterium]|jgi:GTP-binding protein|nr:ribosome biogenesis GTP-binding protein YihA/YsxC [Clostridiales bacterium]